MKKSAAGLGLISLAALAGAKPGNSAEPSTRLKIVCLGAHPDDPESSCGGTLAKLANVGHDVAVVYLTTGEAGIKGKSHDEAAAIRKQEAIDACKILRAKPVFAGQIDGSTVFDRKSLANMLKLVGDENPDLVFAHWPIDSHKDHQVASLLAIQSWMHSKPKFALYFFEVCAGEQTMIFRPTDYVDIGDTQEQKKRAVFCHASQDPPSIYGCGHAAMEDFRGRELGVAAAEAFVRMNGRQQGGFALLKNEL